jgi:hypothetical protein
VAFSAYCFYTLLAPFYSFITSRTTSASLFLYMALAFRGTRRLARLLTTWTLVRPCLILQVCIANLVCRQFKMQFVTYVTAPCRICSLSWAATGISGTPTDGRSFAPLLRARGANESGASQWRDRLLFEYGAWVRETTLQLH